MKNYKKFRGKVTPGVVKVMKPTEEQEQEALFQWLSWQKEPEFQMAFAIPNGGYRAKKTGAALKKQGVKPGIPDMFLPISRDGFHGLWIEMKSHKGKTSDTQEVWHDNLRKEGYKVVVCHSADSAIDTLKNYINTNGSIEMTLEEENERLKWVGYLCTGCGNGVGHHGDWDISCPMCDTLIEVHKTIKLGEIQRAQKEV